MDTIRDTFNMVLGNTMKKETIQTLCAVAIGLLVVLAVYGLGVFASLLWSI